MLIVERLCWYALPALVTFTWKLMDMDLWTAFFPQNFGCFVGEFLCFLFGPAFIYWRFIYGVGNSNEFYLIWMFGESLLGASGVEDITVNKTIFFDVAVNRKFYWNISFFWEIVGCSKIKLHFDIPGISRKVGRKLQLKSSLSFNIPPTTQSISLTINTWKQKTPQTFSLYHINKINLCGLYDALYIRQ